MGARGKAFTLLPHFPPIHFVVSFFTSNLSFPLSVATSGLLIHFRRFICLFVPRSLCLLSLLAFRLPVFNKLELSWLPIWARTQSNERQFASMNIVIIRPYTRIITQNLLGLLAHRCCLQHHLAVARCWLFCSCPQRSPKCRCILYSLIPCAFSHGCDFMILVEGLGLLGPPRLRQR